MSARLRQKLKEFYEGEGARFPLRVSIPLGTHDLKSSLVSSTQTVQALDTIAKQLARHDMTFAGVLDSTVWLRRPSLRCDE